MSQQNVPAIKEFVDAANAFIDQAEASVGGLDGDIKGLKADLEAINTSPGKLSTEDQDSLNSALARVSSLSSKVKALDDMTPDKVPEPPPVVPGVV